MNKAELCKRLAPELDMSAAKAKDVLDIIVAEILNEVYHGGEVAIKGFATFGHKDKPERQGHNPSTGSAITIPARKVAFCKLSKKITIK